MASISSIMGGSSSTSSIYGSRNTNIISGLASGMDTESMIEGMVQSYQQKIISLQQSKTKLQWQQNAYQSISDKLVEFSRKYSSYSSTTNLNSQSFFKNAVITTTGGKYADLITATGKSSSQITINSVKSLASSARYSSTTLKAGAVGSAVDRSKPVVVSQMSGSFTINYGANQSIELTFDTNEDFSITDPQKGTVGTLDVNKFQEALNKKLSEQTLKDDNGDIVSADKLIEINVGAKGTVELKNKATNGDSVTIGGAYGKFADMVTDLDSAVKDESSTFQMDRDKQVVDKSQIKAEYLSGKTFSVTLNGQTKKITLGDVVRKDGEGWSDAVKRTVQEGLDKAFGENRVQVGMNGGAISFQTLDSEGKVSQSDTFAIRAEDSAAGEILFGEGNTSLTSYVDVSKKLSQLGTFDAAKGTLTIGGITLEGKAIQVEKEDWVVEDGKIYDKDGNLLDEEGYRVNKDGERLYEFDMTVNGVKIGTYTQDTALETITNDINANSEAGVSVSYSKLTNEFVFTAKSTGSAEKIDIGEGLGQALFGKVDTSDKETYTAGTDAIFTATVNGKPMEYTRSSNTVDLDGMTVTFEGTFEEAGESVSFTTKTDTDTVFNAIKSMVDDYNAMVTEIKKAYSDMPLQKTDGSKYDPLTSEDEEGMTESEIEAYEEKAKTGILFMDRDLSSLYSALRDAVVSSGADGAYLRSIGINTSYEDGLTTISLDEKALREALETDLDGVANAFNKSKENGAATDGLMTKIQEVTDRYAATTGAVKGILIEKAGSKYAPTAALDNTILDQMKELDKQISTWQSKMSDKVDYYTNKFTQLEMLINQMNSQSSALAGLTGGSY
ncbi:flagellar hook protein [Ruminococcaceae bacterium AM07-15]|nr:flagellar hook protein [Ruminococcaceae bacterium AM07-15]